MDTSILVVGSEDFFAKLPEQIRIRPAFTVEIAANIKQAQSLIEVRLPDVLLVQASLNGSLELCRWLKQQANLSWIYCILVEDRPQIIAERRKLDSNWEIDMTATALLLGADAYVWLNTLEQTYIAQLKPSDRLLLAQIEVGLRKGKRYRHLMQMHDTLSELVLIDPLTELNNRRALQTDLPRQIGDSRTHGMSLSLIMLDVDHFRTVNNTYGHLVGDRVLQLLCYRLRHNLRFQDIPYRYGGEEFAMILHNTKCEEALLVSHRLRRVVAAEPFAIDNTLTINVTISLGVGCLQESDDADGVTLLDRADQHLLDAKAAGRNCVIGCDQQLCEPVS